MAQKKETYSYKGWLNSDSFVKRIFAIMGYGAIGEIFIMLIMLGILIIFGGIGAGIGAIFGS